MTEPRRTKPQRRSTAPVNTGIAEALAARRVDLGVTQQTLADLAGVSRSSVQSLEYGRGTVSFAAFLGVVDALGLRIDLSPKGNGE